MGLIADRLRSRIAEMQERHAETDREIAQLRVEAQIATDRLDASYYSLMAELQD